MDVVALQQALAVGNQRFNFQRKPTIVLFGDSRTDDCDVSANDPTDPAVTAALNVYSTNMSWFDWGQMACPGGPVFEVIRNAGTGGNTTTQMLARIQTDVIAHAPGYMTLWGGTNDTWATTADVDATFARMVTMMQMARKAGIYVFLISETVSSTKGATFPALVLYYNERLRLYAAQNPGVEYWDFNSLFMNPASTTGYPNNPMTRDGTHLSPFGAVTIGTQIVAKKLARFASIVSLTGSLIDTMGNNGYVRNALSNPLMTSTGGTLGTGDSGSIPSGWTGGGTPTAVYSMPARVDGVGNDLQAVITASAGGSKFITASVNPARIPAGVPHVLEAALAIANPTALYGVSLILQMFTASPLYQRGWGLNEQSPVASDNLAAVSGIIRTHPFVLPTGVTFTSASLQVKAGFGAAGGAQINLGRVSIKRVDS
jgi:lysophospholipase L1-like esterase